MPIRLTHLTGGLIAAPPAFHITLKPRGAICNLDCSYCYFLSKEALYPGSKFRMDEGLLEEYTKQYIAAQRVPEVTFAWQGGEPTLMGLEFFQKSVEFQQKHKRPGMRVENALQTNGTLLNDDWCAFFAQSDFLTVYEFYGERTAQPPRSRQYYGLSGRTGQAVAGAIQWGQAQRPLSLWQRQEVQAVSRTQNIKEPL